MKDEKEINRIQRQADNLTLALIVLAGSYFFDLVMRFGIWGSEHIILK